MSTYDPHENQQFTQQDPKLLFNKLATLMTQSQNPSQNTFTSNFNPLPKSNQDEQNGQNPEFFNPSSQFLTDSQFNPNSVPNFSIPVVEIPQPANNSQNVQPWQTNFQIDPNSSNFSANENWSNSPQFQNFPVPPQVQQFPLPIPDSTGRQLNNLAPLPSNGQINHNFQNPSHFAQPTNSNQNQPIIPAKNPEPALLTSPEPTNSVKTPEKSEISQPQPANKGFNLTKAIKNWNPFNLKKGKSEQQKELSPKDQLVHKISESTSNIGKMNAAYLAQLNMDKLRENQIGHEII